MSIITSPLPNVDIPMSAVTPYVLWDVDTRMDQAALIDGPTGRTLTCGELSDAVAERAGTVAGG